MGRRIVKIIVEGRVQRVGYRVFVAREAGRLNLPGWVRERADGGVEALVGGEESVVAEWLHAAQRGPATACIDSYRVEEADEAALREGGGEKDFVAAPAI